MNLKGDFDQSGFYIIKPFLKIISLIYIYRHGIKVAGFSADGDQRLLNSMIFNSKLNCNADLNHTFDAIHEIICFLQDIVHIGTKLRNRLLSLIAFLIIGNKIVSISHLKMLINLVSKDEHGLVYSDICPDDRQNFASLLKIMEPKVRAALEKYVVGSEGTIEYIRICHEIVSSLYDDDMDPLDRIFFSCRSTFFLRAWRLHILRTADNMSLNDNFITSNAYMCIELNTKNLIILTKKFRDEGLKSFFIPTIFNSQPCEETFRRMRSMGTINFTKINFTLLELLHLIGRVELASEIMHFKLADSEVLFPRNPIRKAKLNEFDLPSDSEIDQVVSKALTMAIDDTKKFGIDVSQEDIKNCLLDFNPSVSDKDQNPDDVFVDLEIAYDEKPIECSNLRDYSIDLNTSPDENSRFVNVTGKNGAKTVRKSSLMWTLSNSIGKLSSDRLKRVRGTSNKRAPNRQLEFVDISLWNQPCYKATEIKIGDWCVFQNMFEKNTTEFLVGNIVSFRYIGGRTNTEKIYKYDYALVGNNCSQNQKTSNDQISLTKEKEIEVLASWYAIEMKDANQTLTFVKNSFIHSKYYIANLSRDVIEKQNNKIFSLSKNYFKAIMNLLPNFKS